MGRKLSLFSFALGGLLALAASMGVAHAACSTVASTVTCTGGPAASVVTVGGTNGVTNPGSPYPTTITVSGGSGTVSSISLTLHGYSAQSGAGKNASRNVGLLLKGPTGGHNLQIMRSDGSAAAAQSSLTFTIQDSGVAFPDTTTLWNSQTGPFKPTAYSDATGLSTHTSPDYTVSGGPALANSAAPIGAATLTSVFAGDAVNGNWSLYLVHDSHDGNISFTSWDIAITFSAASTPSTTTLTPNPTTAYTAAPLNSVVLTAQVTAGATGTVTFKDNGTNLTCTEGAQPRTLNGSAQATCTTSFSSEGIHPLTASYSGNGTFVTSSGSANVFIQKHATNVGTTYCNTGTVTNDGHSNVIYTATNPYPSVIFVGDGSNTDIPQSVSTVSVTLKGFASASSNNVGFLLVAPDGTHAFDFWKSAGAGAAGTGDYTVQDGSPQLPNGSALSPGTYGPGAFNIPPDPYTPGPPSPAPQVPGSFSAANPEGSGTFLNSFTGTPAHGAWALFLYNGGGSGSATSLNNGWCLTIAPNTGHPTTTVVTSNPTTYATTGAPVTFTATVSSSPVVGNVGTVTFTENATTLVGAPNGGVSNVVNGVATTTTSSLPEGDHTIQAQYHDSTNTWSDSIGTHSMREDKSTSTPTLNGSTWSYCNTGAILIPRGTIITNDFGQASPNPSNVFVTNLPGTINTVGLTLKNFTMAHGGFNIESLLVGPNGANPPTTAETLDFFSLIGNNTTFGPQDTVFADTFAHPTCSTTASGPGTNVGPTSCPGTINYFASPFYTLPGTFQRATTAGGFTFNTGTYTPNVGGGVYKNDLPNGTWSLYFNQPVNDTGSGVNNGWCMNFVENPVTVTASKGHTGRPPNGHFQQGQQSGASFSFNVTNNGDANGLGSTGDPDGAHGLTIIDALDNTAFTPGTLPTGSPWNCAAVTNTVTCKSSLAIAPTMSYPTLTIPVIVKNAAPASANNTGTVSGGGVTSTSAMDSVTIDPAPILAISKAHVGTFTQGQTATWTLQVSNNSATAAGNTNGSTVTVIDTLPAGYTGWSGSGTGWVCMTNTNVITCTSNDAINGAGGTFGLITLTGPVPLDSLTSVSNSAKVFGGGDVVHINAATAAVSNTDTVTVIQVPATITPNASTTPQSAPLQANFPVALSVTVKDAGGVVIPNYSNVTFLAPASGASGTFSNMTNTITVNTDGTGVATGGTFKANNTGGAYQVTATASTGSAPAGVFNLTNLTPDLTVTKTHSGNFFQGQNGAQYTITVNNISATGPVVAGNTVTLVDTLPNGMTATAISGAGWGCTLATLTCTRNDGLAVNTSYPVITLTVNVSPTATTPLVNSATVSGGGELITNNDTANDSTIINNGVDLTITKTHSGNFTQGDTGKTYTITVNNIGGTNSFGTVTVVDTVPSGLTATNAAGTGWSCNIVSPTVTCTSSTVINFGASGNAITLTVNVAGNATSPQVNQVTVSGGGDVNGNNNSASDSTIIVQLPDLTIAKSHTGNFFQGQVGAVYNVTVTNSGPGPTTGATVTVADTLPNKLTPTAAAGTGWVCNIALQAVSCTRSDVLNAGQSYPVIQITVTVAVDAPAMVTNTATVSGGGQTNTGNDSASDITNISGGPDLTIAKSHTGNFSQGQVGAVYNVTVTNSGASPTVGTVTVADTLPGPAMGMTPTAAAGTGWVCNIAVQTVSCTRNDALGSAQSYPVIQITVTVAANAPAMLTNTATVSGGGDVNTGNNSASDPTTIAGGPDLTIAKSHTGNFTQGQIGAIYNVTVTNSGASATVGTVTVTDALDANLSPTGAAGTGWGCNIVMQTVTCTRNDALGTGQSYPVIQIAVTVAANAPSMVINTAMVSGGGDVNNANNSASDPTTINSSGTATLGAALAPAGKTGPLSARVWNYNILDDGTAPANSAVLTSFTFVQTGGAACPAPVVGTVSVNGGPPQSLPNVQLGNIAPGVPVPIAVTINFGTCLPSARFSQTTVLTANGGTTNATVVKSNQFP